MSTEQRTKVETVSAEKMSEVIMHEIFQAANAVKRNNGALFDFANEGFFTAVVLTQSEYYVVKDEAFEDFDPMYFTNKEEAEAYARSMS